MLFYCILFGLSIPKRLDLIQIVVMDVQIFDYNVGLLFLLELIVDLVVSLCVD